MWVGVCVHIYSIPELLYKPTNPHTPQHQIPKNLSSSSSTKSTPMSAATAAAAASANSSRNSSTNTTPTPTYNYNHQNHLYPTYLRRPPIGNRYETAKKKDWTTFLDYMKQNKPGWLVYGCSGDDAVQFLKHHFDQYHPGNVEAVIGRLRVAFDESFQYDRNFLNPFNGSQVRLYLASLRERERASDNKTKYLFINYVN